MMCLCGSYKWDAHPFGEFSAVCPRCASFVSVSADGVVSALPTEEARRIPLLVVQQRIFKDETEVTSA